MTEIRLLVLAVACTGSCATSPPPRPLPELPPPVDLGQLVGPGPAAFQAPAHVRRFPDKAIRAGQCGPGMPPGILMSPAVHAEQTAAVADARRLRAETEALHRLRTSERAAAEELSEACRQRVAELSAEAQRAGRLSTWKAVAVFVAGGVIGLVAGIATGKPVSR